MLMRTVRRVLVLLAVVLLVDQAGAIGFLLGQSKEELKLKYNLVVHDPANGQVGVEFTLEDEGRLKPLTGVELMIPAQDGSGTYDLSAPLALREVNGKRTVYFHLKKEWAARAEIWLTTDSLDGKQLGLTRYHHVIRLETDGKKAAAPHPIVDPGPIAPPATEPKQK